MNEAKQKFRLTSLERAWILYDVGNSAFVPVSYTHLRAHET